MSAAVPVLKPRPCPAAASPFAKQHDAVRHSQLCVSAAHMHVGSTESCYACHDGDSVRVYLNVVCGRAFLQLECICMLVPLHTVVAHSAMRRPCQSASAVMALASALSAQVMVCVHSGNL